MAKQKKESTLDNRNILFYTDPNGKIRIDVLLEDETV